MDARGAEMLRDMSIYIRWKMAHIHLGRAHKKCQPMVSKKEKKNIYTYGVCVCECCLIVVFFQWHLSLDIYT